jgi:2,4-dienoyl-CoA reductase-like NADH-dependent reductase (Old Yellow Enzyme family)
MSKMTDPITVRGNVLKNRIAMLPVLTFSFQGDDGEYFGAQHIRHYEAIAKGGAGLVITQGTNVKGVLTQEGQWTPACQNTIRAIVAAIHAHGAKAMIQISFGGDRVTDINTLSTEELLYRQSELQAAALLAARLGYDGVEFHFGHGFTLCKLLDAQANQRTDRFGGSLEKRASIVTDILPAIRAGAPDNFILGVRMGAYLPDAETAAQTARHLEAHGIDLFDITYSVVHPESVPDGFPFGPVTYSGALIKQAVNVPVIGVYHLDSEEKVRTLLHNNFADIAGAATPILADYDFPNKIIAGEPVHACRHCEECFWFTDHTLCPAKKSGPQAS